MGPGVMALGRVGMEVRGEKASCAEGDECRDIADLSMDADARGVDDDEDKGAFESMYRGGRRPSSARTRAGHRERRHRERAHGRSRV